MTANHNVDDREIPEATPLLAPWSSLPNHAFPPAPPGFQYQPHGFFFCIVFHSDVCLCPKFVIYLPILVQVLVLHAPKHECIPVDNSGNWNIVSNANKIPCKPFKSFLSKHFLPNDASDNIPNCALPSSSADNAEPEMNIYHYRCIVGTPVWTAEDMNMNKTEWQQVEGVIFLQIYPFFNIWSIHEWKYAFPSRYSFPWRWHRTTVGYIIFFS